MAGTAYLYNTCNECGQRWINVHICPTNNPSISISKETTFQERIKELESTLYICKLQNLLQRIYTWDMMDSAVDGPYWRTEIDKLLKLNGS